MKPYANCLFVSDVDGTMAHFRYIPPRNLEVIQAFIHQGGIFSICTGRAFCSLKDILNQTPVTVPVVTLNGATLYDFEAEKELFSVAFPDGGRAAIEPIVRAFPTLGVMVATDENYYILADGRTLDPWVVERHEWWTSQRGFETLTLDQMPPVWGKVVVEVPSGMAAPVLEFCKSLPGREELAFFQSDAGTIDIMHAEATKGQGLQRLAAYLGIDMARTGAVGDHFNDLDMLERAAWSAAVQGAPQALQGAADYVTCPFEEGATADALIQFMKWIDGGS